MGLGLGGNLWGRRAFSEEIMIPVPSMGDSITEGDLGTIFFQVGDTVNMDDVIAEIETDKVTSEVKAPTSGTITAIFSTQISPQPGLRSGWCSLDRVR